FPNVILNNVKMGPVIRGWAVGRRPSARCRPGFPSVRIHFQFMFQITKFKMALQLQILHTDPVLFCVLLIGSFCRTDTKSPLKQPDCNAVTVTASKWNGWVPTSPQNPET